MKTARVQLDLKNKSCRILSKYIKLQSTTPGHYSLSSTNMLLEVERQVNVALHCKALKMFKSGEKKGRLRNYKGNLVMYQKRN